MAQTPDNEPTHMAIPLELYQKLYQLVAGKFLWAEVDSVLSPLKTQAMPIRLTGKDNKVSPFQPTLIPKDN